MKSEINFLFLLARIQPLEEIKMTGRLFLGTLLLKYVFAIYICMISCMLFAHDNHVMGI